MADVSAKKCTFSYIQSLTFLYASIIFWTSISYCAFHGDHYTRMWKYSRPTISIRFMCASNSLSLILNSRPDNYSFFNIKSLRLGNFVFNYKLTDYRVSIFHGEPLVPIHRKKLMLDNRFYLYNVLYMISSVSKTYIKTCCQLFMNTHKYSLSLSYSFGNMFLEMIYIS